MEQQSTDLKKLTMPVLRKALKERGIKFSSRDKKVDLIKMLEAGESIHKERTVKPAPRLKDSKTETALPIVPEGIRAELEALHARGLKWDIDEATCSITFRSALKVECTTLDQSENNIMRAARSVMSAAMRPIEDGRRDLNIGETR